MRRFPIPSKDACVDMCFVVCVTCGFTSLYLCVHFVVLLSRKPEAVEPLACELDGNCNRKIDQAGCAIPEFVPVPNWFHSPQRCRNSG
mmetsp:Transcript_366/g.833  ORF Transcript_366/g.833 Transcript_366/m.833 type:complete len:88 (-) Transcript_366:1659-1922(-)